MPSFKKLYTLEGSNAGAVLNLKDVRGQETGDWIKVRGHDSEDFQRANRRMRRELLQYLEKKGATAKATDEYLDFTSGQQRELQASLVMEWSFEEPCTKENVLELFKNAPDVAEQVDAFSGKRERFVSASSSNSEPTPASSSSSTSPQPPAQE